MVEISSGNPYSDALVDAGVFVRSFSEQLDDSEMIWHRDRNDRTIKVLEGSGWKFQYDNKLPFEIKEGDVFSVDAYEYHRLLKGNTKLVLQIWENNNE